MPSTWFHNLVPIPIEELVATLLSKYQGRGEGVGGIKVKIKLKLIKILFVDLHN